MNSITKKKQWYCFTCRAKIPDKIKRKNNKKGDIKGRCPSCKRNVTFVELENTQKALAKGMEITKEEAIKLNKKLAKKQVTPEQLKKDTEEGKKKEQESINILKSPDLLLKIIEEVHKQGVQGEEDTVLVLANKVTLRLVKECAPTSSNMVVSDATGSGKDVITKAACILLVSENKLFHRTGLSEKALNYWNTNKDKNFTWDECVLYLEDPEEETLKCQTFRVLSSGGNKASVVKDQKLIELEIPGKPVIIVTSYKATIDEEGGRRWDAVRVDLSDKLTKKVICDKLQKQEGNYTKNKNSNLAFALQRLIRYEVVIPFASRLRKYLPNTLVMRTQVDKLIDYIKASAILHQKQREKDEQGRLIATWFDYDYARFMFIKLRDVEGQALNKIEQELVEILRRAGKPLSIKEAGEMFSRSKKWIYDNLENLEAKGLIKEVNKWDNSANKEIAKIYTDYGYSALDLPVSSVFTGFHPQSENQNKEGFNGFNGFYQICERINEKREKNGLPRIFGENREYQQNLSVCSFHIGGNNQEKPELHEKIKKLKEFCEKEKRANRKIWYASLVHSFPEFFVSDCLQSDILRKLPDDSYEFGGR